VTEFIIEYVQIFIIYKSLAEDLFFFYKFRAACKE